ncbi:high affinity immunoglobulin gamma Fc receptor I-like [Toxotes jaculatrix]|uniref:high affinity immunoglobulin gamma Fc receptor I-like n=1 Tax=Toxotes jaculatrix TaxID=941984 RepID=UPI001B3A7EDF|nr:high affinity immunoglobulin gamma Fc receptor I-like [Toxotes jaculatrix]
MEASALCIRLLMAVLVLLVDHSPCAQRADAAFPHVDPDRLQFFEYESVSVRCEQTVGFPEWRLMKKFNNIIPTNSRNWNTSAPSWNIDPALERHSGEYWCETEAGQRSGAVNISVTAGFVILEIPARPVMEGTDVILHCTNKKTQSQHITDFYKDGSLLGTLDSNNMTITRVSKSDEGLYKCSISGVGESPASWLTVLTHTHTPDAAFPHVDPDRLQFFEFESVSVRCEQTVGFPEWRLMKKFNKIIPTNSRNWNTSAPSWNIYPAFERHSGEYWCETEAGERSGAVNISVTAGFVILEIPPRPVMEGTDVILHCTNKKTQSQHITDFYKDGSLLGTLDSNNMTITRVSKSDEGLYKCSISGVGESPASWLTVLTHSPDSIEETQSWSLNLLTVLWIVASGLLVTGILLCWHKEPELFRPGAKPPLPEEDDVYSQVVYRPLGPG